jgi:hypothetical protein
MKTYSNYDFSFNYPEGMAIVETGLTDTDKTATRDGGIVTVRDSRGTAGIVWVKIDGTPINLDESHLAGFKKLQSDPRYTDVTLGEMEKTSHLGHTVSTINYNYTESGKHFYGQAAWWYCPESGRTYFISVDTTNGSTSAKNTMMTYLDSFKCH